MRKFPNRTITQEILDDCIYPNAEVLHSITMLTFVFLIVYSTFTGMEIPEDSIGRSAEKIVPGVVDAMKGKEEV